MPRQNTSPLRRDIFRALALRGKRAVGIRLSMSKPEWYQPPDAGEKVWVRWFFWRLVSRNDYNVTRPKYGIFHGGLTQRTLERSLREWFPDHRCTIDGKIDL